MLIYFNSKPNHRCILLKKYKSIVLVLLIRNEDILLVITTSIIFIGYIDSFWFFNNWSSSNQTYTLSPLRSIWTDHLTWDQSNPKGQISYTIINRVHQIPINKKRTIAHRVVGLCAASYSSSVNIIISHRPTRAITLTFIEQDPPEPNDQCQTPHQSSIRAAMLCWSLYL